MSRETDLAFIEDYHFMLANGESHETAAARLGTNGINLKRQLLRVGKRLEDVRDGEENAAVAGRIAGTTQTTPAARQRCNPGSNHREGVAS